ncbi:MAG: hypothetical protein GF334_06410 [Candidatus Altiarchaeales archaeon]|nr:hypothetical protein [Candidatus Altiarchaeales archaeon]
MSNTDDLGYNHGIKIGTTKFNMEHFKVTPHIEFIEGTQRKKDACGGSRWTGPAKMRLTWPNRELEGEQFYQLKNIVGSNPSASVYIDVPTQILNTDTYQPITSAYYGILQWPDEGVRMTRYYRWTLPEVEITNLTPI